MHDAPHSSHGTVQGFTAVFGFFLVPSKHMPSAAFQRAMLHGEAQKKLGCGVWSSFLLFLSRQKRKETSDLGGAIFYILFIKVRLLKNDCYCMLLLRKVGEGKAGLEQLLRPARFKKHLQTPDATEVLRYPLLPQIFPGLRGHRRRTCATGNRQGDIVSGSCTYGKMRPIDEN